MQPLTIIYLITGTVHGVILHWPLLHLRGNTVPVGQCPSFLRPQALLGVEPVLAIVVYDEPLSLLHATQAETAVVRVSYASSLMRMKATAS